MANGWNTMADVTALTCQSSATSAITSTHELPSCLRSGLTDRSAAVSASTAQELDVREARRRWAQNSSLV